MNAGRRHDTPVSETKKQKNLMICSNSSSQSINICDNSESQFPLGIGR